MKVFFDERMVVENNTSFSPSAGKPSKVMESWAKIVPIERMAVWPVTSEELKKVHNPKYVDCILNCTIANGFGNKLQTVADSLLWTNGSFVSAARYAWDTKENVVSPTSGFHHACYNQAMGFCTFNGLILAAIILKEYGLQPGRKIAIADIDMHYGNGTDQLILEHNLQGLINHFTFGHYHHSPDKPLKGNEFLPMLPAIMDLLLKDADILFYQAGADPHVNDPYGGSLTTEELKERDRIVFTAARDRCVPVVWNLAGGYQSDLRKVLDIHDNTALMHMEILNDTENMPACRLS